jgi:adenylate cyclase class IV
LTDSKDSLQYIEFEVKHSATAAQLVQFKQILEKQPDILQFVYVAGPDSFFTYSKDFFEKNPQWDEKGTFVRYRKPSFGLDKSKKTVTWKYKPAGAKNNIIRKEHNWEVGKTPENVILEQLKDSGLTFNSSIVKDCHIYIFKDATVVFYIVYDITEDSQGEPKYFVEIEVDEKTIDQKTENEAWEVIEKYEKILSPLGISSKTRIRRSLFEMYRR